MDKQSLMNVMERFANLSKAFQSPTPPVYLYQLPDDDKWRVSFKDIRLGIFEDKEEAKEFATIVAKTNDTVINVYINGKTEEVIKI